MKRHGLVLEMVAHEPAAHAGHRVGETNLPTRAHMAEGLVVRPVLARQAGHERRRLARVAQAPTASGYAHDRVAAAHLLLAERSTDARETSVSPRTSSAYTAPGPGRCRRIDGADLSLQHRRRVHERRESGRACSSAKRLPVRPASTERPAHELGIDHREGGPARRRARRPLDHTVPRWADRRRACRCLQSAPSGSAISVRKKVPRLTPEIRRTSSPMSQPNVTPW